VPSPFAYTNTTLTTTLTSLLPGQTPTLAATVSAIGFSALPTGPVLFIDRLLGSFNVIGSAPLIGGKASLVTGLSGGSPRTVMAVYSGDTSFNGSGSPDIALYQPSQAKIVATVTLSFTQTPAGGPTVFRATVTPPAGTPTAPTGQVVLTDGPNQLGAAYLTNGVATLPLVFDTAAVHSLVATYLGDTNYSQVASPTVFLPAGTAAQVTITSSAPNSTYGQAVQLTISVVPSSATGTIQLTMDGSAIPGFGTLINGSVVAYLPTNLGVGSHTFTAAYLGDANNAPATSAPFIQNIAKATPSFTVTSSLNPSAPGQAVTLTVTMTPTSAGLLGLVIGNPPANLTPTSFSGRTTVTTADLSTGTHTVQGTWAGDANILAGSSAVLIQTVQPVTTPTATSLAASPNPSIFGGTVTLTAMVSPAGATGGVAFYSDGVSIGTANLVNGQAQVSIAALAAGAHSLTAVYAGDPAYRGSTSPAVTQTVTPAMVPSMVSLSSSANPSAAGQPLTIAVGVSPATATGTIQFLDGAAPLGTVTLANGSATLSISTLAVGTHSITALYSGDVNVSPGASGVLAEVISPVLPPVVVMPQIISALMGLPDACAPGVSYCGIRQPVSDAAGNLYFQDGYQILKRTPGGTVGAIAGNGQQGTSGDGGPALSASIDFVGQLAVHGSRVCFGEPAAYRIRCVDTGTGLIQGYGTGIPTSGGDGGNVANASFYYPTGAAFDDAGNLYISDLAGSNVRRIADSVERVQLRFREVSDLKRLDCPRSQSWLS